MIFGPLSKARRLDRGESQRVGKRLTEQRRICCSGQHTELLSPQSLPRERRAFRCLYQRYRVRLTGSLRSMEISGSLKPAPTRIFVCNSLASSDSTFCASALISQVARNLVIFGSRTPASGMSSFLRSEKLISLCGRRCESKKACLVLVKIYASILMMRTGLGAYCNNRRITV